MNDNIIKGLPSKKYFYYIFSIKILNIKIFGLGRKISSDRPGYIGESNTEIKKCVDSTYVCEFCGIYTRII